MVEKKALRNRRPSPPYAPWSEMREALAKLRSFRPSRVDVALLQTYGIAPKNERAVINGLKYLGIIDPKGVPTAKLERLQVKGEEYTRNLKAMVQEAYADIVSRIDLTSVTPETIHNYFMAQKVGPSVASKCSRFFIGLCREAGLEVSPALASAVPGERRRSPVRGAARRGVPRKDVGAGDGARRALMARLASEASPDLLGAKLKLFEKLPNFDASWTPEAIELVFREFNRLWDRLEGKTAQAEEPAGSPRSGGARRQG